MAEWLDLVNDNDEVVGKVDRDEACGRGERNIRVINIILYNSEGKILTPLRTEDRRIFPNCYDFSVGGFVDRGEDYEKTAYRELEEELGITSIKLEEIGYFKPSMGMTHTFSKLYKGYYDQPIETYDQKGIKELYYFTLDEIQKMIEKDPKKFKGNDYINIFNWLGKESIKEYEEE